MEDKTFEVKGTFLMGDDWKPYKKVISAPNEYKKVISAPNEKQARERTFAVIGSKHNLKRMYIKIDDVTLVKGE
ncbi:MAG: 50S ribosomal protein L18Ae [Methanoregula sp.]|nr:50S ribosomal protein L18Ae [Methanoregula sp.]